GGVIHLRLNQRQGFADRVDRVVEILFGGIALRRIFHAVVVRRNATVVERQSQVGPDRLLLRVELGRFVVSVDGARVIFVISQLPALLEELLHTLVLFRHLLILDFGLGALLLVLFLSLLLIGGAHLLAALGRVGLHAPHISERQFAAITVTKLDLQRFRAGAANAGQELRFAAGGRNQNGVSTGERNAR